MNALYLMGKKLLLRCTKYLSTNVVGLEADMILFLPSCVKISYIWIFVLTTFRKKNCDIERCIIIISTYFPSQANIIVYPRQNQNCIKWNDILVVYLICSLMEIYRTIEVSAITRYPEYYIIIDIKNSAWTYLKYHVRQGGNVALNQS